MSETRVPLCRTKGCPFPNDPFAHVCILCPNRSIEHHHVKPRGMGGSKERRDDKGNVVLLCVDHHNQMTLHKYKDEIKDGYYIVRNRKDQVIEKKRLPEREINDGTRERSGLVSRPGSTWDQGPSGHAGSNPAAPLPEREISDGLRTDVPGGYIVSSGPDGDQREAARPPMVTGDRSVHGRSSSSPPIAVPTSNGSDSEREISDGQQHSISISATDISGGDGCDNLDIRQVRIEGESDGEVSARQARVLPKVRRGSDAQTWSEGIEGDEVSDLSIDPYAAYHNEGVSDGEVSARQADDGVLPEVRRGVAGSQNSTGYLLDADAEPQRSGAPEAPYAAYEARAQRVAAAWQSATGIKSSLSWETGDLLVEAERELGEEWAQLAELFDQKIPTLHNMMLVCQNIPEDQRHHNLHFAHHAEVYKLNREDRDMWLDKAEAEGWKASQLREAIHGPKPERQYACPECGHSGVLAEFKA